LGADIVKHQIARWIDVWREWRSSIARTRQ